jgi:hypothetical protein
VGIRVNPFLIRSVDTGRTGIRTRIELSRKSVLIRALRVGGGGCTASISAGFTDFSSHLAVPACRRVKRKVVSPDQGVF